MKQHLRIAKHKVPQKEQLSRLSFLCGKPASQLPRSEISLLQSSLGNQGIQRLLRNKHTSRLPRSDISLLQSSLGNQGIQRLLQYDSVPVRYNRPIVSVPPLGAKDEIVDIPRFVITPVPIEAPPTSNNDGSTLQRNDDATSCDEPMSMTKVTSGAFQGALSMGDYYPDLVGRGYWDHGDTAGPWDTGSRAGVNVQLFGTVPSPCRPDQFHLEQTVTRERERINGTPTAREGTSADDIANSGRDASTAPFRQLWLGGGLNISMADPPSAAYSATRDIDIKKHFVTSLAGPGGKRSVNWTIELKIENGTVTKNAVT
ncbi:MAG: hypothetical protein ACE5NW_18740 [Acidiferrobacterales bacterium]